MLLLKPQLLPRRSDLLTILWLSAAAFAAEPPSPAMAFYQALEVSGSTREERQEAWQRLQEAGKPPPRQVIAAVGRARDRAWRQLPPLLTAAQAVKAASGLRSALAPHQAKVRDLVNGDAFSKEGLDEAMAPIEKALEAAAGALEQSDKFKALSETLHEMETYAVGCGLRIGWSEELREVLLRVAFVNQCAGSVRWRRILEANRELGARIDPAEHACIDRLNIHRILIGLQPVEIDLRLVVAGKKHSEEMVAKNYFAHESPTEGLKSPWQRAAREHTRASGECIAYGQSTGVAAFTAWYYSHGHHKIMISGAKSIGVGRCENKWTLMAGGSGTGDPAANKMAYYVRRRYEAGGKPEPLLELAKWCASSQLLVQAQDELERLLVLAPDNETARKALERMRARRR